MKVAEVKLCRHAGCGKPGLAYDKKCLEHTQDTYNVQYTAAPTESMKNPIGIEIECYGPYALRHVHTVRCGDGSINAGGQYGIEIKTVASKYSIVYKAMDLANRIQLAGGKTNSSCGLHVHISLPKQFYYERVRCDEKLLPYFKAVEREVFSLFPFRSLSWVRRLTHDMLGHSDWANIRDQTVEIRIHPGTVKPLEICGWLSVCKGLQKVIADILEDKTTRETKLMRAGKFVEMFRKGSQARKYLDSLR